MSVFRLRILGAAVLFLAINPSNGASLYSDDDPLYQLNSTNFDNIVLGKNKAWIIQFYNSWCGHCIRFAPTFKEFSRDVKTWRKVIDVGVVNCNDAENVKLCRQYDVNVFPTIKLFWLNLKSEDQGEMLQSSRRDIPDLEAAIINFLEAKSKHSMPSEWPKFEPVEETSLESLSNNNPDRNLYVFFEESESLAGRKVILDLSFQKKMLVRRALPSSRVFNELNNIINENSIPTLLKVSSNIDKEVQIIFSKNDTDNYIRDKVFLKIMGKPRNEDIVPSSTTTPSSTPVPPVKELELIHLTDLENALYNSLYQEIGVVKQMDLKRISVVKEYLSILRKYFPGTKPVRRFLTKLHDWLSYRLYSLTGEEFVATMNKIKDGDAFLPEMRPYVKCSGSKPQYRGYPCSLWSLFHWLTVQADKANIFYPSSPSNHGEVLFVIRDYVKYFFTCQECAEHFLQMAHNVEKQVNSSSSAVMWLWGAHNTVNKRLAGDSTEDPSHPKVQFPLPRECPYCRKGEHSDGIDWDRTVVLQFLHQFYSTPYLRGAQDVVVGPLFDETSDRSPASSAMVRKHKKKYKGFKKLYII